MEWLYKKFDELKTTELYEIMKLRQKVFVVEQNCVYLDSDDLDTKADHIMVYEKDRLVGYARVTHPGSRFAEFSIGRVVTAPEKRGTGLGKELTQFALQKINDSFGNVPVRISAQAYLEEFYKKFGFEVVGKPYDEDGIPHIEMFRNPELRSIKDGVQ